jgi:hypothetical protein
MPINMQSPGSFQCTALFKSAFFIFSVRVSVSGAGFHHAEQVVITACFGD